MSRRFLFILLGPLGKGPQYHEIGRSIATLMTDEVKSSFVNVKAAVCHFEKRPKPKRTSFFAEQQKPLNLRLASAIRKY